MSDKPVLTLIKMNAFGGFANQTLGPFKPGLNVIKGRNEAGKSTTTSFIGQVLYGWESVRSTPAHYKPGGTGKRSGWLRFTSSEGEWRLLRDEGTKEEKVFTDSGTPWNTAFVEVTSGVDKTTYSNVFSFNSDQLKQLENTGQITSKLLTAGSATAVSPVQALERIEAELDTYTKSNKASVNSIPQQKLEVTALRERKAELEAQIQDELSEYEEMLALEGEAEELKALRTQYAGERREIEIRTADAKQVAQQLSREQERAHELARERGAISAQLSSIDIDKKLLDSGDKIVGFAAAAQMQTESLATVDRLTVECEQLQALIEEERAQEQEQAEQKTATRVSKPLVYAGFALFIVGLALLVATAFIAQIPSLLAVPAAILVLLGGVFVWRGRGIEVIESQEEVVAPAAPFGSAKSDQLREKQNTLAQEQARCARWEANVVEELALLGIEAASGHELVAQVSRLVFELEQVRSLDKDKQELLRKLEGVGSSLDYTQKQVKERATMLASLLEASVPEEGTRKLEELTIRGQELIQEEARLQERAELVARLIGEKRTLLGTTHKTEELKEIDLNLAEAQAILETRAREYLELSLASQLLRSTIAEWEEEKQPTIYTKASELFSTMTAGKWKGVRPGEKEGELVAVRDDLETLPVQHLSTSTMQLLYLALRLALLESTQDVGRSLPVVIDDAFVHLDDTRSEQVARVISDFAKERQVLLFTFKDQTVELFEQTNGAPMNLVEL